VNAVAALDRLAEGFSHEALLYAGTDEFVDGASRFIEEGLAGDEATLVVVSAAKIARLRERLGPAADRVAFRDMAEVGANPARIIPAWRDFVDAHAARGGSIRGIGEPIWAGQSDDELVECQLHESLVNVAFADTPSFRLLCPYDTETLGEGVIAEAECSHPVVMVSDGAAPSGRFRGLTASAELRTDPLPEPTVPFGEVAFDVSHLYEVRRAVGRAAADAGFSAAQCDEVKLAVSELCSNSIRHGGGSGTARFWVEDATLVCEVRDGGRIHDPMVGRVRPTIEHAGGFGVWLVNQLSDLVQVRTSPSGTTVRLRIRRR
jgi:anti-sigma regulatory factor (Ser/Thr protein kinase)